MGRKKIKKWDFRDFVFNDLEGFYDEGVVGREISFEKNLGNDYYLRILTSIPKGQDEVREKDAIRVHVYKKGESGDDLIDSASSTKRTEGYQSRIRDKIKDLIGCPKCYSDMNVGDGEYGKYFFCSDCDYTEPLEE